MNRFRATTLVVVLSVTPSFAASAPRISAVALTGQQAPGTSPGTTFSVFGSASFDGAPAIGADDTVAFAAILSDATAGFWLDPGFGPALLARSGSPAPGTEPGVVFSQRIAEATIFTPPLLSPGHAILADTLRGPGVGFGNDEGLWSFDGSMLSLVVREGTPAPGLTGIQLTALAPRALDGAGRAILSSTLTGAVVEGNNASLWRATPGAALQLLVREGDAAPGVGFGVVFAAPLGPVAFPTVLGNAAGDLLFQTNVHGPGTDDTNDEALFVRDSAGTRLYLREGSPVPGLPGYVFGNGSTSGFDPSLVSFGDDGIVALVADVSNGVESGRALLSDDTGSLRLLVRFGDPAPGGAGSFELFGRPVRNARGDIAFLASVASSPTRFGLWIDRAGIVSAVALPEDVIPGQPDAPIVRSIQILDGFNDDGFVLFTAELLTPGGFGSTALLLADPSGEIAVVARTGAPLTVADGDARTVGEIVARVGALNADSQIAFGARFTDGSGAELRAFGASACTSDLDCLDGDPCTDDSFSCAAGACVHVAATPKEAANLSVSRSSVSWDPAIETDAGTGYQVIRGSLASLPVGSAPATESCLADATPTTTILESTVPASGSGFWYLVRARHACGTGTYGDERVSTACP